MSGEPTERASPSCLEHGSRQAQWSAVIALRAAVGRTRSAIAAAAATGEPILPGLGALLDQAATEARECAAVHGVASARHASRAHAEAVLFSSDMLSHIFDALALTVGASPAALPLVHRQWAAVLAAKRK